MKKDLEDFTVEDFEPFTSKELISMCCAHGLLFIDPKKPPESKRAIAERMVAFFREEKEKARIAAREERMGLAQPAKSRARPRIPGIESPEEKKKNPRPETKRARRPRRRCPRRSCRRRRWTIRRTRSDRRCK